MVESAVSVTFSADASGFLDSVSDIRKALDQLRDPFSSLETQYGALRGALDEAFDPAKLQAFGVSLNAARSTQAALAVDFAKANEALREQDQSSYQDAARAARLAIDEEDRALETSLRERLVDYAQDARFWRMSQDERVAASKAAIDEVESAERRLYSFGAVFDQQSAAQRQALLNEMETAELRHQQQILAIRRDAEAQQAAQFQTFAGAVDGAFNRQIDGLLRGTTNWRDSFKNTLETLLVDSIRWVDQTVAKFVAGEAAKNSAAVAGAAARTQAEESSSAAGLAMQADAILRSIFSSSAETFAGVFGFLSPIMGPAAIGPAVAAQATVAAAAGRVASADIGMWDVPQDMLTLIHHNELVMPAAQAEAFRDMLSSGHGAGTAVHIHPTTNFHVAAIDSGSVAQWVKGNSATMLRAIDEAVRHGAHLGLRRLGT